jgi:hypothetical protein
VQSEMRSLANKAITAPPQVQSEMRSLVNKAVTAPLQAQSQWEGSSSVSNRSQVFILSGRHIAVAVRGPVSGDAVQCPCVYIESQRSRWDFGTLNFMMECNRLAVKLQDAWWWPTINPTGLVHGGALNSSVNANSPL